MKMKHIRCPLNKYTFRNKPMRDWVESACKGKVLNLFAGPTKLNINEVRNDLDPKMAEHCEYTMDALDFVRSWEIWRYGKFDTVLLDPPYSFRKSMEMYSGKKNSRFKLLKDAIPRILKPRGLVITFGYHSVSMGKRRGFSVREIVLFSHGGAIHDTISTVERKDIETIL